MKVDRLLKEIPNSYFESIQQKTIRGTPDKIGCVNGLFVALELKATERDASPLQKYKLHKFSEAGGIAITLHPGNLVSTLALLKSLGEMNGTKI